MSDPISLDFDGPVAIVSNNRPEKHNAANNAMDDRLWEVLGELHRREGVRAVVWRGDLAGRPDPGLVGLRSAAPLLAQVVGCLPARP